MRLLIDFNSNTNKNNAEQTKPTSPDWKYSLATLALSLAIAIPQVSKWVEESQQPIRLFQRQLINSKNTAFPTVKGSSITSGFGWRIHPITLERKFHSGIDFGAKQGAAIYSFEPGLVEFVGWKGGYGKTVIVNHGEGKSTLYGHASKIVVRKGERVVAGETIAKIGSTGNSTGPHLHFEIRVNNKSVNPYPYLQEEFRNE